jgi:polar amino acid transport system substrate-binding protein
MLFSHFLSQQLNIEFSNSLQMAPSNVTIEATLVSHSQIWGHSAMQLRIRVSVIAAILSTLALTTESLAKDLQLIASVLPPYANDVDGKAVGPGVDILKKLAEAAGITAQVVPIPFARVLTELDEGNTIVATIGRVAEREAKYEWIGEVYPDYIGFVTVAPSKRIDDLETAKAMKSVSVLRAALTFKYLQKNGFTNLDEVNTEEMAVKKLEAKRTDAWLAGSVIAYKAWKDAGIDVSKFQIGKSILPAPQWIGASKNVDPAILNKMRAKFQSMVKSGEINRIRAQLKPGAK